MTLPDAPLREPMQIFELRQVRCSLRFGVGACTATGVPLCYQSFGTCRARAAFDGLGRMRWRFVKARPGQTPDGDFANADDVATPCIQVPGLQISTASGSINVAGVLDGKSPFGTHAKLTVTGADVLWDDEFGDFYRSLRGDLPKRMFFQMLAVRDPLFGSLTAVVYDGYVGDDIADMRARTYLVESISTGRGRFEVSCISPLTRAESKTALFPPAMDVRLAEDLAADALTLLVETEVPENLSDAVGISRWRELIVGGEIISYSAIADLGDDLYRLTIVNRGEGETQVRDHSAGAAVQRVGFFEDVELWKAARFVLKEGSPLASFIDDTEWAEEGDVFLSLFVTRARVTSPTQVLNLLGEMCQQGLMMIFYDEFAARIRLQAVKPPQGVPKLLTDDNGIVKGSAQIRADAKALLTRAFLYYRPRVATSTDDLNYAGIEGRIEQDNELTFAAGSPRTLVIKARWIVTETHAFFVLARILSRYFQVPRFLSLRVSGKDRVIDIGEVYDIESLELRDTEGRIRTELWQVIQWEEIAAGEVYMLDLQSYSVLVRYGRWMADGAPDYGAATAAQRAVGAWWADDNGLVGGDPGFSWQ